MKLSYYFSLFLFIFGVTSFLTSEARIQLSVSMIHEIGHDRNMVLKAELHSIEKLYDSKRVSLGMQEGMRFDFEAEFIQRSQDYGPSPYVLVRGDVYDYQGELLKRIDETNGEIKIGTEKSFVYTSDDGRKIEVIVKPEVDQ